ncbi:MAG: cephalosporin hydroxylase family protein [Candidatus Omnitrophica bacterium]|nr:cephalosporin hydroxylase family protein [Candidatus Omnitrophota bacterium]
MNRTFELEKKRNIQRLGAKPALKKLSRRWIREVSTYQYSYHFNWLGRPIIQFPQDILALQEIIWNTRPGLIIETGVAHGGSLIFFASMLELIGGKGKAIGIDIHIRPENRRQIEHHPLSKRILLLEGSSIDPKIIQKVRGRISGKKVMVILDSNHTHDHVLRELELYSPFVTPGNYLIVFDTIIEHLPGNFFPNRPWGKNNNPASAVREFVSRNWRFKIDREIENKLLITAAPSGYLQCIKP